jgi:hypothetical protein
MPAFFAPALAGGRTYAQWLTGKSVALRKHDRRCGNHVHDTSSYRAAIHTAMKRSGGVDEYSGRPIDWSLAFVNRNAEAGAKNRRRFAAAPSLDHVTGGGLLIAISRDDTNSAKGCMTVAEFYAFCAAVAGGSRPFVKPAV